MPNLPLASRAKLKLLYKNLGGRKPLLEILKDFYKRMSQDILIGFFFDNKDTDKIAAQQQKFLLKAMGVAKTYAGKTPARAHDKLPPILAGHFDRRIQILRETLEDHELAAEDIRTWLGFERAFRAAIVDPAISQKN